MRRRPDARHLSDAIGLSRPVREEIEKVNDLASREPMALHVIPTPAARGRNARLEHSPIALTRPAFVAIEY